MKKIDVFSSHTGFFKIDEKLMIVNSSLLTALPPCLPYTAGPLPQVPPPSSPACLLVPRFYALHPTPARPLPDVAQ